MKLYMRKHWLLTSALIGVFLLGSLAVESAAAAAQQITLTTDKPEYRRGDNLVVTAKVVRAMDPKKATLWLTSVDQDAHEENQIINLDFEAILKRGQSDRFRVPKSPGEWELELHDLSKGPYVSAKTFVTKVSFKVLPSPESNSAPEASAGARSSRSDAETRREAAPPSNSPYIRMVNPHVLVLGEEFQVQVALHRPARIEDKQSASVAWAFATGPNNGWTKEHLELADLPSAPSVPDEAGKTVATVSVLAPFNRPGNYELRLSYGDRIVGALPVKVITGEAQLSGLKQVYRPGEAIDFSVTLPENRYYAGHVNGPSGTIFPINVGGRVITPEQALADALPTTAIGGMGWVEGKINPHGGAFFRGGTYNVKHADNRVLQPLFAPNQPGKYEIRFYDRVFDAGGFLKFSSYYDLYLARQEFEVKAKGPDLRFVSKCSAEEQNSKELKELVQDAVSFLAARFDIVAGVEEAPEKTSPLEYVDGGREKTTMVKLKRVAPGFYCSDPIVPVAPAEPRRSERRS